MVEPIPGADVDRVTLTAPAAKRLDIQTAPVRDEMIGGTPRTVIPYSGVLYDPQGNTWAYTNPEPLVFVRHAIAVDRITEDLAVLTAAPPTGMAVVTVGAAELIGTEVGIGKK